MPPLAGMHVEMGRGGDAYAIIGFDMRNPRRWGDARLGQMRPSIGQKRTHELFWCKFGRLLGDVLADAALIWDS